MAKLKHTFPYVFSRLRNNLVELQRWWPAFIKNRGGDGSNGLSVDPVLYKTNFGPDTASDEGGLDDEATTPGVRLEICGDDGSEMAGTYTLTISGSGTYNPRATLNYDGDEYVIMLIAPDGSNEQANASAYQKTGFTPAQSYWAETGAPSWWLNSAGPYPVFMTLQEFAEMLDTADHVGMSDTDKRAFAPWGLVGRTGSTVASGVAKFPAWSEDTRIAGSSEDPVNQAQLKWKASVFMPMLLDNNQFGSDTTNADVSFAWPHNPIHLKLDGYSEYGISRYDPDPDTGSAGVKYKTMQTSGDFKTGAVGAWSSYQAVNYAGSQVSGTYYSVADEISGVGNINQINGFTNADNNLASSAAIGPKYRMRMALACFLKDGTYTLNDGGAIIPYIYDSDRVIGGKNTTTLYSVWDGRAGYGNSQPNKYDCSAQIYPMFDFVQGPLCPSAQGNNFDSSVIELEHPAFPKIRASQTLATTGHINPRQFLVRPNPKRSNVLAVSKTSGGILEIIVESSTSYGVDNPNRFWGSYGMPIRLSDLEGALGTGAANASTRWDALPVSAGTTGNQTPDWAVGIQNKLDHNGWWILQEVGNPVAGDGANPWGNADYQILKIQLQLGLFASPGVTRYYPTGAYVSQGRMSGYEADAGSSTTYLNAHGIFRQAGDFDGVKGTSTGAASGFAQMDSNSPVGASTDSTYPGRPTLYEPEMPNSEGQVTSATNFTSRSISIRSGTDDEFATAPTITNTGNGVLRVPPPIGWDMARYYYSNTQPDAGGYYNNAGNNESRDYKYSSANDTDAVASLNARWASRGVSTPFWSFMDPLTGRHAWNNIKPPSWQFGRNRPWPAQERVGTRAAYVPSLFADAKDAGNGWTATASGNYLSAGEESTLYGITEIGCSPTWVDMEMSAFIPVRDDRLVTISFDNNASWGKTGRHSMMGHGGTRNFYRGEGFYPLWDGSGDQTHPVATTSFEYGQKVNNPSYVTNRPMIWIWGSNTAFFTAAWANSLTDFPVGGATTSNNGWGGMGDGDGYGTRTTVTEGYHTIRTLFNEGGMTYILDGNTVGTDSNSAAPVYGLTIKVSDALALLAGGSITNNQGELIYTQRPNMNMSHADLQIDNITMRQIPTPQMLPFPVFTKKVNVSGVARYTSLTVEALNISTIKGMNITASIYQPATYTNNARTFQTEPSTIIEGFDNLDLGFAGGYGSLDLSNLPTADVGTGFQVAFNFYIPNSAEADLHPINWDELPIITAWTVNYDLKPTTTLTVTGNTYDGDTTSPISMKVGHVVTFQAALTTADPDRTIKEVKFEFGDGVNTGWITLDDTTQTSINYSAAHVYTYSSGSASFEAKAYAKDDAGNEGLASNIILVTVAETKPIAILRVIPGYVSANTAVVLDATSSYIVSSDTARTIASYTFDAGDGSGTTTQAGSTLAHTYTAAGEYLAVLTCTDNASSPNTSLSDTVLVKVITSAVAVDLMAALNTKPKSFVRKQSANLSSTPLLSQQYPEIIDTNARDDVFSLSGSFLKTTGTTDVETMEGYLTNATLVRVDWQEKEYDGSTSVKSYTGYVIDFDYEREGGSHGETPWNATFVRAS